MDSTMPTHTNSEGFIFTIEKATRRVLPNWVELNFPMLEHISRRMHPEADENIWNSHKCIRTQRFYRLSHAVNDLMAYGCYSADVILHNVFTNAGFKYRMSPPQRPPIDFAPETTPETTPDTTPANNRTSPENPRTTVKQPSKTVELPKTTEEPPGSLKKGTKKRRLKVDEPDSREGKTYSVGERFCWNIAYWLEDRVGDDIKHNSVAVEQLGLGLRGLPHTNVPLNESELACIDNPETKLTKTEYKSLRARIIIGCACIYEHNLRVGVLNARGVHHDACKPDDQVCKYINTGASQAQLLGYGNDVTKSSLVLKELVKAEYVATMTHITTKTPFTRSEEAERCYPKEPRRKLYRDLWKWYEEKGTRSDLKFVIPGSLVGIDDEGT